MKLLQWAGVLLAGLTTFVVTGGAVALLLVRYGWDVFGWHDSMTPEVVAAAAVGALGGLAVIFFLGSGLSGDKEPRE